MVGKSPVNSGRWAIPPRRDGEDVEVSPVTGIVAGLLMVRGRLTARIFYPIPAATSPPSRQFTVRVEYRFGPLDALADLLPQTRLDAIRDQTANLVDVPVLPKASHLPRPGFYMLTVVSTIVEGDARRTEYIVRMYQIEGKHITRL